MSKLPSKKIPKEIDDCPLCDGKMGRRSWVGSSTKKRSAVYHSSSKCILSASYYSYSRWSDFIEKFYRRYGR